MEPFLVSKRNIDSRSLAKPVFVSPGVDSAVGGLDLLPEVSLLQSIPVLQPQLSQFVLQNDLLKNAMFREAICNRVVTVG